MGLFDYITATCPNCQNKIKHQVKILCCFDDFNLDKPLSIEDASTLKGSKITCESCNKSFEIIADIPTYKIHVYLKEIKDGN